MKRKQNYTHTLTHALYTYINEIYTNGKWKEWKILKKNQEKIKGNYKEFRFHIYILHATWNIQHTFTNTNTHAYIYIFSSEINMLNIHTSHKK